METSSASPSTFTRAAASSIASGRPSTRRAISARADGLGVQLESGRAARARWRKSSHGVPSRSGATAIRTSPATWSASRLVASTRTGHSASTADAIRAASSRTCSHASRTTSTPASRRREIDARERIAAASVNDLCEQPDASSRAARAREVDEPDAVREFVLERARRLHREPALADAGRPDERHEAVLVQQRRDLGELLLAADERGRRCGQVASPPAADRDGGDRRVMREDRLLEPPKLRPRLEPQLVGEHAPRLLEGLERIRLAAAAIERQHQLPPQPLPERIVRQRRPKRGDELPMLAERERRLELLLERVDAQRLEPPRLGAEPTVPVSPCSAVRARGQRRRDRVRRGMDVAVPQRGARLREQLLEPDRIHIRALQRVPVGEPTIDSSPSAARRRAM